MLYEYLETSSIDQKLLEKLINLYLINCKIDPNRVATGVDIYRNFEYLYPLEWLKKYLHTSSAVLDIGSSSSTWPAMLFDQFHCKIYATDIDLQALEAQKFYLSNLNMLDEIGRRFILEEQDATKLKYSNGFFDAVCAISALEHIPGNGDILAVQEIERVLKSGGMFIFTAPFAPEFIESNTDHYHHGYEKRYDYNAIQTRFTSAKELCLEELLFINGLHEDTDILSDFWYKHKLFNTIGKISPFFSMLLFEISTEPTERSRGFIARFRKK